VTRLEVDLRNLEPLRIQKQLRRHKLTQTSYNLQISNSSLKSITDAGANKSLLKKSLRLENSSSNSKIIVYPLCYVLRQNADVFCQLSDSYQAVICRRSDKSCMVDLGDGVTVRFRMALGPEAVFCQSDQLVWFKIEQGEAMTLDLEFELVTENDQGIFVELEKRLHQNFNIGMFWVESDLNAYCVEGRLIILKGFGGIF
jgi:hypothetical protein